MSPSFDKNVKHIITTLTTHTYIIVYQTDNKHTPLFLHQKYFEVESSVEYHNILVQQRKT